MTQAPLSQDGLRRLVDLTWGKAMEDGSVPSSKIVDELITAARIEHEGWREKCEKITQLIDAYCRTHKFHDTRIDEAAEILGIDPWANAPRAKGDIGPPPQQDGKEESDGHNTGVRGRDGGDASPNPDLQQAVAPSIAGEEGGEDDYFKCPKCGEWFFVDEMYDPQRASGGGYRWPIDRELQDALRPAKCKHVWPDGMGDMAGNSAFVCMSKSYWKCFLCGKSIASDSQPSPASASEDLKVRAPINLAGDEFDTVAGNLMSDMEIEPHLPGHIAANAQDTLAKVLRCLISKRHAIGLLRAKTEELRNNHDNRATNCEISQDLDGLIERLRADSKMVGVERGDSHAALLNEAAAALDGMRRERDGWKAKCEKMWDERDEPFTAAARANIRYVQAKHDLAAAETLNAEYRAGLEEISAAKTWWTQPDWYERVCKCIHIARSLLEKKP